MTDVVEFLKENSPSYVEALEQSNLDLATDGYSEFPDTRIYLEELTEDTDQLDTTVATAYSFLDKQED